VTDVKPTPVRGWNNKSSKLQPNDVLQHPMAALEDSQSRTKWKYKFLRVTRFPSIDRPDSGRIMVENAATGKRTEHFALLFNVRFE
jgi:hypothetical protein